MSRHFVTGTGQRIVNVHDPVACRERHCPIHAPSQWAERIGVTHWRGDRAIMERICDHGVGHPDPDHMLYIEERYGADMALSESVHGCDGCCGAAKPGVQLQLAI